MRIANSLLIRVGSQAALAAAAFSGLVPGAFAQSTENLIIGFASAAQAAAVPLSPGLTVAIALALAAIASLVLRGRPMRRGRLFGWLLAICAGATLAIAGGEGALSEARAAIAPAAINLSVSPGILDLLTYWNVNIDPLTVTITNATAQQVRITSVAVDNTNLYALSTPTTCVVGAVLAPNAQCTVTLSIQ